MISKNEKQRREDQLKEAGWTLIDGRYRIGHLSIMPEAIEDPDPKIWERRVKRFMDAASYEKEMADRIELIVGRKEELRDLGFVGATGGYKLAREIDPLYVADYNISSLPEDRWDKLIQTIKERINKPMEQSTQEISKERAAAKAMWGTFNKLRAPEVWKDFQSTTGINFTAAMKEKIEETIALIEQYGPKL